MGVDSVQYFQAQLPGQHPGVALRFVVRLNARQAGWYYQLARFEVRFLTGQPDIAHWLLLHRLLDDPDFWSDILRFQQQLQSVLPAL